MELLCFIHVSRAKFRKRSVAISRGEKMKIEKRRTKKLKEGKKEDAMTILSL